MQAWIGMGSNLGDRKRNLDAALQMLQGRFSLQKVSNIYETEPWGYTDQPAFLNQVVEICADVPPMDLLTLLKKMEHDLGREPTFHLGPRLIDLDILIYGDMVYETPTLVIPHPHMAQRAFVLVPLAEIAPHLIHPVLKQTISELLAAVDKTGVNRYYSLPTALEKTAE